jgi:DNA-binding transcriptional ArsR family regulator
VGAGVLRVDMDSAAVAGTRFAISPLGTAIDALWLLREDARAGGGGWRALVGETVRDQGLTLLAGLFGGAWDYLPDFLAPQPDQPEERVQDELHAVAAVAPEHLLAEIGVMLQGHSEVRIIGRPAPRSVLQVLDRGERAFAERAAAELHQLWRAAIEPHWPALRARMEADIEHRARTSARQGLSAMLTTLHPRVVWGGDHLQLATRFQGRVRGATTVVLRPSVFSTDLRLTVDPLSAQMHRQPVLGYPCRPGPDPDRPATPSAHALLGVTRARLLSDLAVPRSTAELGERHFLAPSTVSYHLGILHRSGLVTRTRRAHHVLYQQSPRAGGMLHGAPSA